MRRTKGHHYRSPLVREQFNVRFAAAPLHMPRYQFKLSSKVFEFFLKKMQKQRLFVKNIISDDQNTYILYYVTLIVFF